MTKLQELKEAVAKVQELTVAIEKEESSIKITRYDDQFYYMPLAILGMAKRFYVVTMEELKVDDGRIKEECVCTFTYQDMLSGKTIEQCLAEFVAKRRIELGL